MSITHTLINNSHLLTIHHHQLPVSHTAVVWRDAFGLIVRLVFVTAAYSSVGDFGYGDAICRSLEHTLGSFDIS